MHAGAAPANCQAQRRHLHAYCHLCIAYTPHAYARAVQCSHHGSMRCCRIHHCSGQAVCVPLLPTIGLPRSEKQWCLAPM